MGYQETYATFSRTLRTWFVAYGIGAPVLFLSSETVALAVAQAPDRHFILLAFVIGASIQVLLALFYKTILAYLYFGETDKGLQSKKRYRFSKYMYSKHLPELLADLLSVALFAWGTFRAFSVIIESAMQSPGQFGSS